MRKTTIWDFLIFLMVLIVISLGVYSLVEGDVISQEKIDSSDPYFEFFDCRTEYVDDSDADFYFYQISCLGLTALGDGTYLVERKNAPILNYSKKEMVDCLAFGSEFDCIEKVRFKFLEEHLKYFGSLEISFDNLGSDKEVVLIDKSVFVLSSEDLNPNKDIKDEDKPV